MSSKKSGAILVASGCYERRVEVRVVVDDAEEISEVQLNLAADVDMFVVCIDGSKVLEVF